MIKQKLKAQHFDVLRGKINKNRKLHDDLFSLQNELKEERVNYTNFTTDENRNITSLNVLLSNINNINLDIQKLKSDISFQRILDTTFFKELGNFYTQDEIRHDIAIINKTVTA